MHATFNDFGLLTMRRFARFSLILMSCMILGLVGCSTTVDPADAYPNETPEQIFTRGEKSLKDRSYQDTIKRFEALEVQYPYAPNTKMAQLHLIYAYYMTNEYISAEAAADRFIHSYPTNPHVDYAYYLRGLSNYYQNLGVFEKIFTIDLATRDLAQIKKSYADFAKITTSYSNSIYAAPAHQYMIYLRNVIANHELRIARYYYERGAYIASIDRAHLIVSHYQGAPAVPQALVLMVKSYRKLSLTSNANDAMRVLEYNYPNSAFVKQAKE